LPQQVAHFDPRQVNRRDSQRITRPILVVLIHAEVRANDLFAAKMPLITAVASPRNWPPARKLSVPVLRVATPLGFEPRITPPKGAVLPLHHGVVRFAILDSRFSTEAQSPIAAKNSPRPGSQIG
jgi:hypothetical protein